MRTILLLLAMCFAGVNVVEAQTTLPLVESFVEARDQARLDELDETTRGYHRNTLLPEFGAAYRQHFNDCSRALNSPDTTPFSFVAAIGVDGRVVRVFSDRSTPLYQCVRGKLLFDRFTPPPRVPFYLLILMRFPSNDSNPRAPSQ